MAKTYSIYEAKAKLSELLRSVKAGNEVIISERGTPIAKILPLSSKTGFESRLDHLRQSGQLRERKTKRITGSKTASPGALKRFLNERD